MIDPSATVLIFFELGSKSQKHAYGKQWVQKVGMHYVYIPYVQENITVIGDNSKLSIRHRCVDASDYGDAVVLLTIPVTDSTVAGQVSRLVLTASRASVAIVSKMLGLPWLPSRNANRHTSNPGLSHC